MAGTEGRRSETNAGRGVETTCWRTFCCEELVAEQQPPRRLERCCCAHPAAGDPTASHRFLQREAADVFTVTKSK